MREKKYKEKEPQNVEPKKRQNNPLKKKVVPTVVEENPPIEDVPDLDLDLDSEISSEREEILLLTQKLEKRKEHLKQLLTLKKTNIEKEIAEL